MKTLKKNGLENINFDKIAINEHFIYMGESFEFFAIKVSEDYAVFINADGKFICAKAFKNCLSIGAGVVSEFPTFDKAVEACGADIVERSEIAFYGQRDKMMSVSDYARKHGVDPSTVRHKISRGLLPAVKFGKMWLIKESEPWTDQRRKKQES